MVPVPLQKGDQEVLNWRGYVTTFRQKNLVYFVVLRHEVSFSSEHPVIYIWGSTWVHRNREKHPVFLHSRNSLSKNFS